jgi:hypothetical protein
MGMAGFMVAYSMEWIGLRETLKETIVFTIKYIYLNMGFSCKISLQQIQ